MLSRRTCISFCTLALAACGVSQEAIRTPAGTAGADAGASTDRPFSVESPFNVPIGAAPVLDPIGGARVAYLARKNAAYALIYEFGIPIVEAKAGAKWTAITCSMSPAWGNCPFADGFPMVAGAAANSGSDGVLVIVDRATNRSYEFWQFRAQGQSYTTSWGAIQDLGAEGWGGTGSSTAAGASRLGGVVRLSELEAGRIEHALVMSIDNSCTTEFWPPAIKTDGNSTREDCTPQGARLQLDPTISLAEIPGITRGELTVARALQEYGVYVIDKGGGPMGIGFELAADATGANAPGALYVANGFSWDYFDMPRIPWSRLRVLKHWDGT